MCAWGQGFRCQASCKCTYLLCDNCIILSRPKINMLLRKWETYSLLNSTDFILFRSFLIFSSFYQAHCWSEGVLVPYLTPIITPRRRKGRKSIMPSGIRGQLLINFPRNRTWKWCCPHPSVVFTYFCSVPAVAAICVLSSPFSAVPTRLHESLCRICQEGDDLR